jgi:quercetin dioxygenase-like cupin family protein
VKVTVRGEHTGGVLASIEETLQPGAFVTPHTHANDVWVYVLSGTVGVLVGDEIGEAGAGEWALKPRNVPHAMWNASHEPARLVEVLTPAGTERWFEEIAALDATDCAAFDEACQRHGITFHRASTWTAGSASATACDAREQEGPTGSPVFVVDSKPPHVVAE